MKRSSIAMLALTLLLCAYTLPAEETFVESLVESHVNTASTLQEDADAVVPETTELGDTDSEDTDSGNTDSGDTDSGDTEGYETIEGLPKLLSTALDHLLQDDVSTYKKVTTELMKHKRFLIDLETFEGQHPEAAAVVNKDALTHASRLVGMIDGGTQIFKGNFDNFEGKLDPSHSKGASKEAAKAATMLANKWNQEWKKHEEEKAHVPHPRLVHTLANTLPHKWQDVFTSKEYGLEHLLSLPVAKIDCDEVSSLFAENEIGQSLKLRVPDVRGHKARIGRTRLVNAEVVQLQGESSDSADAKIMLVLRDHRLRTKKLKRVEHKFFHGSEVAIDVDRDVVVEATPHRSADGQCHKWYVRHPKEGTDALAQMLEKDNRKGLEKLLGPLSKKMKDALIKAGALKSVTRADGTKKHVLVPNPQGEPDQEPEEMAEALAGKGPGPGERPPPPPPSPSPTVTQGANNNCPPPGVTSCNTLASRGHANTPHSLVKDAYDGVKKHLKANQCPGIDSQLGSVHCSSSRRRNVANADYNKRLNDGFKSCCDCMKRTAGYAAIGQRVDQLHPAWFARDPQDPKPNEQQCLHMPTCAGTQWCTKPAGYEVESVLTQDLTKGGKGGPTRIEVPTAYEYRFESSHSIASCVMCNCLPECTEFAEQCYEVGSPRPRKCNDATKLRMLGGWHVASYNVAHYRNYYNHGELELEQDKVTERGGKGRPTPSPTLPPVGLNSYTDRICCGLCNANHDCAFWYHNGHTCWLRGGTPTQVGDPNGHNPSDMNGYRGDFKAPETSYDGKEVAEMRTWCKHEDGKDVSCVKDAVLAWYANDICMGSSCTLAENQVTSVILGIVIYIVDSLLGCALSFLAQPSFWIAMTGAEGGADETAQAATVASEANGIKGAGVETMKEGEKKMGHQMAINKNKPYSTQIKDGMKNVGTKAKEMITKTKGINPTEVKSFMAKGFKNWLPCLPLALLAWLEGGTSFFTCMMKCMIQAIGETIASLVFRLVKDCLWKMIKEAMEDAFSCFPADATVQLSSGQETSMRQLQVGDRVLTKDGSYSEVYVLSHQNPNVMAMFVSILVENGQHIDATARHFVYTSPKCDGSVQQMYASAVKKGMCMFTQAHGQADQSLQRVVRVSVETKAGVYNPFTLQGSIVVNGIAASCHSDWFLDDIAAETGLTSVLPQIYQAVLLPARGLFRLMGPEVARRELMNYQTELEKATEAGWVVKPYWDLFQRAVMLITGIQS